MKKILIVLVVLVTCLIAFSQKIPTDTTYLMKNDTAYMKVSTEVITDFQRYEDGSFDQAKTIVEHNEVLFPLPKSMHGLILSAHNIEALAKGEEIDIIVNPYDKYPTKFILTERQLVDNLDYNPKGVWYILGFMVFMAVMAIVLIVIRRHKKETAIDF